MVEELQIRIAHDLPTLPTLIYLPGLHGDWTVVGNFRRALNGRVRFVEITYPRTLTWSLDDYAAAVEQALAEKGIHRGWLLGESFSSQVVWPIAARNNFSVEGVILIGGFARHPWLWAVRLAEWITAHAPHSLLKFFFFLYAKTARLRFRNSPETQAEIKEFVARRTRLDLQAIRHRLQLIARNDPRDLARDARLPVFGLTGFIDPIVPWLFARRWLQRNCPALREYKVVWHADHNVLSTAPRISAEQVLRWMGR